jgi:hypothetical protein
MLVATMPAPLVPIPAFINRVLCPWIVSAALVGNAICAV